MDCATCGASAQGGKFCSACGCELPHEEPVAAEPSEADEHFTEALATSIETDSEANLLRAQQPTEEDVEIVEAVVEAEIAETDAGVVEHALDAVVDVATAALDAVVESHAIEETHEEEPPPVIETETPPQPEDGPPAGEHVEPITLLAPEPARSRSTTTTRSSSWRRHRR